jgi:hypothetical protein
MLEFVRRLRGKEMLFPALVLLAGIIYVGLGLTPSSYGLMLTQIGAPEAGPIWGTARPIRSDEFAVITPLFQAAVRNGFREINETSFYRESLRSVFPVPLRNWSLIFRPQQWAFFLTSASTAYSFCFAFLICASLVGYQLLFRELGLNSGVAAAVSVLVFFSGFIQFWGLWSLAGIPWILLVLLKPLDWRRKALLLAWLMPATALAHPYPPFFMNLGVAALLLLMATRRGFFRSSRELAAVAIGALVAGAVLYGYFAQLLPIMANTVYPGHRTAPPGTVPVSVALSQIFPFLAISLSDFRSLAGLNVVEDGTVGSYFVILTLCLTRFRDLARFRDLRHNRALTSVLILISGATAMTLWQLAPVPLWIGRAFHWDTALPERLFSATGLLLTFACVVIWSCKLISAHPARILIFFFAGPVASLVLKIAWFGLALSACEEDIAICCFAAFGCMVACYRRKTQRAALLAGMVAAINLFGFGQFNPLQPAAPIFNVPETALIKELRRAEASMPGHFLLDGSFLGATANGMGFRSVNHVLPTPQLAFFRKTFPAMNAERFNFIFNRYAHIQVTRDPLPFTPFNDAIRLPFQAFEPIRNLRYSSVDVLRREVCITPTSGAIERGTAEGSAITLEGWAPWKGENAMQGLRVLSSRAVRAERPITLRRPDVAEWLEDYGYVNSGFQVRVSSADGHPIRAEEIVLAAMGTAREGVQLVGFGCR